MADTVHKGNLTDEEKFLKRMQFLILADKMKSIYRQTLLADKARRETDAEHSWLLRFMHLCWRTMLPTGRTFSAWLR